MFLNGDYNLQFIATMCSYIYLELYATGHLVMHHFTDNKQQPAYNGAIKLLLNM
jgi:hypothetical protein